MQCRATHELNVVVALTKGALAGLADNRERLGHEVVQGLTRGMPLAELIGQGPKFRITQARDIGFDCVDGRRHCGEPAEGFSLASAQDLVKHAHRQAPSYMCRPVDGVGPS